MPLNNFKTVKTTPSTKASPISKMSKTTATSSSRKGSGDSADYDTLGALDLPKVWSTVLKDYDLLEKVGIGSYG